MEKSIVSKIDRINELKESIRKIEYFNNQIIDPEKNIRRGSGSYDINVCLKVKSVKSYSIFGSRYIGGGSHAKQIDVPNELISGLQSLTATYLIDLQTELNSLLS